MTDDTRRLKIVSDGTSRNTHILDALTGEDLHIPCTSIILNLDAGRGFWIASITVILAHADVEIKGGQVLVHPTSIEELLESYVPKEQTADGSPA